MHFFPRIRARLQAETVSLDAAVRQEVVQAILKRDEAAAGLAVKRARWREREAGVQEEARLRLGTMEVRKRPV